MPPPPPPTDPIPPSFQTLKSRILKSLAVPTTSYTDASPKGTLDTAIVPLIERLNTLEGVGRKRVAVREVGVGGKDAGDKGSGDGDGDSDEVETEERVNGDGETVDDEGEVRAGKAENKNKKSVPGGKGMGGRWLFVSHERLEMPEYQNPNDERGDELTKLFGLTNTVNTKSQSEHERARKSSDTKNARFVRFAFEPMILHIATASLNHAAPILSAAISSGFRESGVQSLKNLTDPNAIPMVAVRSAGLAFESIIAIVREGSALPPDTSGIDENQQGQGEVIEALVGEEYLEILVGIANERFEANTERIRRFEEALFGGVERDVADEWEDKETRQKRKRAEGLRRREELNANRGSVERERDDPDVELPSFENVH
ncbi:MAG: hypothetical protein Q9169_008082 [Polycauliona sp. 2 TL-2023]